MCKKFNLNVYGKTFTKCFLHFSKYVNGDLQVSVFGVDPDTNLSGHFLDISLEQNVVELQENEIIVDHLYKPEIVEQLEDLGILKEKKDMCVINFTMYPIYSLDVPKLDNYTYVEKRVLCAA